MAVVGVDDRARALASCGERRDPAGRAGFRRVGVEDIRVSRRMIDRIARIASRSERGFELAAQRGHVAVLDTELGRRRAPSSAPPPGSFRRRPERRGLAAAGRRRARAPTGLLRRGSAARSRARCSGCSHRSSVGGEPEGQPEQGRERAAAEERLRRQARRSERRTREPARSPAPVSRRSLAAPASGGAAGRHDRREEQDAPDQAELVEHLVVRLLRDQGLVDGREVPGGLSENRRRAAGT